jgi:DDE superfamily endonuclease
MGDRALAALRAFRAAVYACFGRRRAALGDLLDAVVGAGPQPSLAHLSLAPAHRRGWGSLYAALRQGQIDVEALRRVLHRFATRDGPAVYAVDVSAWPRCDAATSPGRAFHYSPTRHLSGEPVVSGWAYQWVVQVGLTRESWTAPVDVQRLPPAQTASALAVEQLKAFVARRPANGAGTPPPVFLFDAGYSLSDLAHGLADTPVSLLIRLRSDRHFFTDPVPGDGAPTGRPRRNGPKFVCADPATWPPPTATHRSEDPRYGGVEVRAWAGLHTYVRRPVHQATYRPRAYLYGVVLRVHVTRLPGHTRKPQVLWLWWQRGPGATAPRPDLAFLWQAYTRRYDIEHSFRFLKGDLNWVTPRVRLPEQADRWTWLVAAAYTQLRLARGLVAEQRLPWEQPVLPTHLTPGRVQRAFSTLLLTLGTPAAAPKPCGRSPGRPKGRRSPRAARYPPYKKPLSQRQKRKRAA